MFYKPDGGRKFRPLRDGFPLQGIKPPWEQETALRGKSNAQKKLYDYGMADLICCGDGNPRFAQMAIEERLLYGARLYMQGKGA